MPKTKYSSVREQESRRRLALEAARIMAEEGVHDYLAAKRKAALRLGFDIRSRHFPTNREIEAAVDEYHRLFQNDSQISRLRELREAARNAMRMFADFSPRLVGSVLSGTATRHAEVQLHLFADPPEKIALFLLGNEIPFDSAERRHHWGSGRDLQSPVYRFMAGDVHIETVIFPIDGIREAPLSPVNSRPMRRASIREVETLLGLAEPSV